MFMKKNTTITFLILLSIIISSNTSAEEINAEIGAQVGVVPVLQNEEPHPRPNNSVSPRPVRANMNARAELRQGLRQDVRANLSASTTEIRVMREENKSEIKKLRADFQTEVKTKKASSTELLKEKRQALIEGIQEKRDLFKKEIAVSKEAIASSSAAVKAKFKADLSKIKDEWKKEKVENIGENLIELNTKITTKSSENINKIEEVLIAIESRADKATANGVNVLSVRSLITMAEVAIADARAAIIVQTAKTYIVTINSDAKVKTSVQTSRNLLKADIDAMNAKIKAAHAATKKAANTLKAIPKVNANSVAEVSGSTTISN